jgi:ribose 1,5-bisphosphokinase
VPPFVYVMGPSGVGKDSLLRFARAALQPGEKIAFAHRYITRPVVPEGENHIALSDSEFEARREAGLFSFAWSAHGFRYGIGVEVELWRQAGLVVVLSGSRELFRSLPAYAGGMVPVLVTASPEALASRLASRGREDRRAIAERLDRAKELDIGGRSLILLDNSGPLEAAGNRFVELLRDVATRRASV